MPTDEPTMQQMLLYAVASMALLGGVLGLILAIASKKFHVETDPRIDELAEALPGINCGACGYAGCAGYAAAIVEENAPLTLCSPGGAATVQKLGGIMGVAAEAGEPNFAFVRCHGTGVRPRFHYDGISTCAAASVMGLAGSFQDCRYGCLGLGDCIRACPFGAISLNEQHVAVVDEDLCAGCGKCIAACPRSLTRLDPESRTVFIRCANHDKGAVANTVCSHGCIACRKCEKECPFDAIHVVDNLAVIDYEKCKLCGKCVKVCPKECIVNLRAERRARRKKREATAMS